MFMELHKRKRDTRCPRITYHAPQRTFDRLFKEESLNAMKEVVRAKLDLPHGAYIVFEQIRDGKPIDLEDDDDFDAFYSLAHATSYAEVMVKIKPSQEESSAATKESNTGEKESKEITKIVRGAQWIQSPNRNAQDSGSQRKKRKVTAKQKSITFEATSPVDSHETQSVVTPTCEPASSKSELLGSTITSSSKTIKKKKQVKSVAQDAKDVSPSIEKSSRDQSTQKDNGLVVKELVKPGSLSFSQELAGVMAQSFIENELHGESLKLVSEAGGVVSRSNEKEKIPKNSRKQSAAGSHENGMPSSTKKVAPRNRKARGNSSDKNETPHVDNIARESAVREAVLCVLAARRSALGESVTPAEETSNSPVAVNHKESLVGQRDKLPLESGLESGKEISSEGGRQAGATITRANFRASQKCSMVEVTAHPTMDLDSIMRGPNVPPIRAADISSRECSEEEDESDVILEEESDKKSPRGRSTRLAKSESSEVESEDESYSDRGNNKDHPAPPSAGTMFPVVDCYSLGRSHGVADQSGDSIPSIPNSTFAPHVITETTKDLHASTDSDFTHPLESLTAVESPAEQELISEALATESSSKIRKSAESSIITPQLGQSKELDEAEYVDTGDISFVNKSHFRAQRRNQPQRRMSQNPSQDKLDEITNPGLGKNPHNTWTVLTASSTAPEGNSQMIDELRSTSPGSQVDEVMTRNRVPRTPAKTTFGKGSLLLASVQQGRSNDHSEKTIVSPGMSDQAEVSEMVSHKTRSGDRYRSLSTISDIGRRHTMFSTSTPRATTRVTRLASQKAKDMYGRYLKHEIEESNSESNSESDAVVPSHIPKARLAGAKRPQRPETPSTRRK